MATKQIISFLHFLSFIQIKPVLIKILDVVWITNCQTNPAFLLLYEDKTSIFNIILIFPWKTALLSLFQASLSEPVNEPEDYALKKWYYIQNLDYLPSGCSSLTLKLLLLV